MWESIELKTNIIQFSDGTFFNGVKGKCVRKTHIFADAKRFDVLSDRDERYLKGMEYEIIPVIMSVTKLEFYGSKIE